MNFWRNLLTALGLTTFLTACDSFEALHEQRLKEAGFRQEQAEVGAAMGLRGVFSEDEELEGGNTKHTLHYGGISDEDVLFTVQEIRQDLEEMLDVHDNFARAKFLQNSGLQPQLERQEKVFRYHEERLQLKVLYRKFGRLIQGKSAGSRSSPGDIVDEEKYSLVDGFPFQVLPKFEADYVKAARDDRGNLDPETIVEDLTESRFFFEKEPNPEYLVDKSKDPERVVQRKHGVRIIGYNLDGDDEKQPDYLEVFRTNDGKQESQPAIKVFKPNGTGDLEVVVLEGDREGEAGYGIPDLVEEYARISSGRDVKDNPELMDPLFEKEKQQPRQFPEGGTVNEIYIVKSGTTPLDIYETKIEGWEKFLPEYHSLSRALNATGKINKRMNVQVKTNFPRHAEEDQEKFAEMEWIALLYEGDSRVIEFYKPKAQFRGKKYKVTIEGRKLSVQEEEGQIKQYDVVGIIDPKPYRVDFDRNQQKRWEILDRDSDGKHYEAKREKARPEEVWPVKE